MSHAYLPVPSYNSETYVFADGTNVTVPLLSYVSGVPFHYTSYI